MPYLPLACDCHDGKDARCAQLLALQHLRGDLERGAPGQLPPAGRPVAVNPSALARELQELIAALDRRMPHVAKAGEAAIAHDAALLRAKAVQRLAELEGHETSAPVAGPEKVQRAGAK